MAKARRIPGLSASDPYAAAAARIVEARVQEVIDHSHGVLDLTDIERVHEMRVATRRLRAVLEIFEPCFPGGEVKASLRKVKALADALGERRDRDVAIAALKGVGKSMAAPDRTGIETLITRLHAEQAAANEALVPFVSGEYLASMLDQVSDLVAGAEPASNGNSSARTAVGGLSRQEPPEDGSVRAHDGDGGP